MSRVNFPKMAHRCAEAWYNEHMERGDFPDRLDAAMYLRDLTPKGLAHRADISQRYVNALLAGERKDPGLSIMMALAKALDVSLDWLAGLPRRAPTELDPMEDKLLTMFRQIEDPDVRELVLGFVEQQIEIDKKIRREG